MKFILGKKLKMTQMFDENGEVIPVTLVKAGPCKILQIKNEEKDGYNSIQVGFEKIEEKKAKKPQKDKPFRYLKEFRISSRELSKKFKVGDEIRVDFFEKGDIVKVSGISKGKGFQGVVRRHGFKGSPATHGTKHTLRAPGSIGSSFPERVWKGKKMAGRMGGERVTVKNLQIAEIDKENNLLAIKGAIPGRKGTLVEIVA